MQNQPTPLPRLTFLLFCLPALFAAIIYFQTWHFDLVWDDTEWVQKINAFHGGFLDWIVYSFSNISIGSYYRPLTLITYFYPADTKPPAMLWHQINYVLHVSNLLLLGMIFTRIFREAHLQNPVATGREHLLAGIGLLLFVALHPSQVETASWVSCRFDLMSNGFLLAILWLDKAPIKKIYKTLLIPLLYLLALLAKETAIIFLTVYPLLHIYCADRENHTSLRNTLYKHRLMYGLLATTTLAYVIAYLSIAGHENIRSMTWFSPLYDDLPSHIRLIVTSLGYYLRLFFYPFIELSPFYYHQGNTEINDPALWLGLSVLLLLLYVAMKHRQILPLLLIGLLSISPYLNWVQLSHAGNIIQNRYLSLPLILCSICAYMLLLRIRPTGHWPKAMAGSAIYLLLLALTTISIVPLWKNNLQLWTWVVDENPDSAIARANLGHTLMTIDQNALAIPQLEKSLQLSENFNAHTTLAYIFYSEGDESKAILHARMAIQSYYPFERKMLFLLDATKKTIARGDKTFAIKLLREMPDDIRMTQEYQKTYAEILSLLNDRHEQLPDIP